MHGEIRKGIDPLIRIGRKALPQSKNVGHKTPAPFIRHFKNMAHETGKGQPAIGLDDHGISAAAEQMHLRRPGLKRHRGIVKGRGTRAQHRHHAALECGEINRIRAMGALIRRQRTQEIGHPPFANAFLPCRQHHLARQIRPG